MEQQCVGVQDWLRIIERRAPESGIILGLDRMRAVYQAMNYNRRIAKRIVVVGGTNGKGGTVASLESILKAAGRCFGALTSPHLFSFNERIRINGNQVEDWILCQSFSRVDACSQALEIPLTFFEFTVLVGFEVFHQYNLDVVVLEVGMGGRLDAVNIMDADIAIITTISKDHQRWLGDSVEAIAKEKAGIYRSRVPAIFGDNPVPGSIQKHITTVEAIPFFSKDHFGIEKQNNEKWLFWQKNKETRTHIGEIPRTTIHSTSTACSIQAALLLGIPFHLVKEGLRQVVLSGRNQRFSYQCDGKRITLHFDVAHNEQSIQYLADVLNALPIDGRQRVGLVAVLADKSLDMLSPLLEKFTTWYASEVAYKERALPVQKTVDWLEKRGKKVLSFSTLQKAACTVIKSLTEGDEMVIFGSFHTVAEVGKALELSLDRTAETLS